MNNKSDDHIIARVEALLFPRNIVIAGATDKAGNWPQRVWRNLQRYHFKGAVYPYNPSREQVWDTKCYQRFDDLPEPPDQIIVLTPAQHVVGVLRQAHHAGARSAIIMTSGFGEALDEHSQELARALSDLIKETGLAVSGPNCLGNFNARHSMFAMTDDRPQQLSDGPVAVFGQSGGIVMALKRTLEERGINSAFAITSGNEAGLNSADYIHYFAHDPKIKVIVCYLEAVHDSIGFLEACRLARAQGKMVVVMKLGSSNAGQEAAAAHTGKLAGSMAAFDAVAGQAGVVRAKNLDDVIEIVDFCVHAPLPKGRRLGAITFSGGMRGLFLDAADEHQLSFAPLSAATHKALSDVLSVGSIIGNPLDAGFSALRSGEAYLKCVEIMLADPDIDILFLQEELPRAAGTERKEANLRGVNQLVQKAQKPVIFVSMISYGLTDYSRALRHDLPHLAFLQETQRTLRAVAGLIAYHETDHHRIALPTPHAQGLAALKKARANAQGSTLNEHQSKDLFAAYGVACAREVIAQTWDEAQKGAADLGYPLVLKALSADVTHKTDAGLVVLNIGNESDLRRAWEHVQTQWAKLPAHYRCDGYLLAQSMSEGLDLFIGCKNDPDVGPVIVFGSGGIDVELVNDSAVAALPLSKTHAKALISRTKAGQRLRGIRSTQKLAEVSVIDALVKLSHLMCDSDGHIAALDINPFRVDTEKGLALDGVVIFADTKPKA